ncbi:mitochondrial fission ELM1 family protein [Alphaproteobacteria bacterium LSUCC0684]
MAPALSTTRNLAQARTCWVVSDGTKGMEVQSIGLAKAMGLEMKYIRITLPWLLRRLPRLALLPRWPMPDDLLFAARDGWPDLVITTGHRMAGLSILIRRNAKGRTQSIHIQDPRLPATKFDYLIVPSHDRIRSKNVIITTGSLNALTPEVIKEAGTTLSSDIASLPKPIFVVMTGGSNHRYRVRRPDYYDLGKFMALVACKRGGSLAFVLSRRSQDDAGDAIKQGAGSIPADIPIYIWNGEDPNPYPGILDLADAVIVTSDSVNMTSEACLTGKSVYTYAFREETGRISKFHKIMQTSGYTSPLEQLLEGEFTENNGRILDETARVAALLRGR